MAARGLQPLVDRIMGGTLSPWLTAHQDLPPDQAVAALERDHDISVSVRTMVRWIEANRG